MSPPQWTPYEVAQAMLKVFPVFGRFMGLRLRESGEEEATLMQISVLMRLQEHPITTSELAKHRKVSLQSASVLVQSMVERGWLTRVPDPNDRRQSLLQVTPEGAARAQVAQEHLTEVIAGLLQGLSEEELASAAVFIPALQRLAQERMVPESIQER
ncbi:MAG: MarR family transcriptional regulator [Anaerolineae bacterium]|nr:MarR family transcriptional regulator [Anaerolineae bacterium]